VRPHRHPHRNRASDSELTHYTWLQLAFPLLVTLITFLTGALFANSWVRFNVDKFSLVLWAAALGLFAVCLLSKISLARIIALCLASLLSASAVYLESARPWCMTAEIDYGVTVLSDGTRLPVEQDQVAVPSSKLTISAAPGATSQSGIFAGWGAACTISKLRGDGRPVEIRDCSLIYEMGSKGIPNDIGFTITRPSCRDGGLLQGSLRLVPAAAN
jgi:hypothetical protein